MKTPILFQALLLSVASLLPAALAENGEPAKKVQIGDEQHQANLAAQLTQIQSSKTIGLMNWNRERAKDKNEGWVKLTLSPEQLAEVQPILARMKVNPKASLKVNTNVYHGHNMPMTNWVFEGADGKPLYVSMTYKMTADPNSTADWLLSQQDLDALKAIVEKYVKAAL